MSSTDDVMHRVFQQNDDMAWRIVDDECIIVDPQGSTATVLNPTGARIWELVDGKRTVASIVDEIVDEYDADRAQVEADAREFVEDLLGKDLIQTEGESAGD